MNPISRATSVIFHPVRTATAVAGQSLALARAGVKTTMHIIDRATGQSAGRQRDWVVGQRPCLDPGRYLDEPGSGRHSAPDGEGYFHR